MTTLLGYVRTIISIQWSNFHKGNRCGSFNDVYSNVFLGWWSSNMATVEGWMWWASPRRHCCLSPSVTQALWGCPVSAPLGCEIKQFEARLTFGSHFWCLNLWQYKASFMWDHSNSPIRILAHFFHTELVYDISLFLINVCNYANWHFKIVCTLSVDYLW